MGAIQSAVSTPPELGQNACPTSPVDLKRQPISAFVITFNEEDQIDACLSSLSFCDEIVIIDSFSTDKTLERAQKFGARVIQRAWPGYCDQKAFGLAACSHDWVINVDADERISDELRENILAVLRKDFEAQQANPDPRPDRVVGYSINRTVYFLSRWWRKGGWYPEYRLRLVRKSGVSWGGADPHEKAIPHGPTERLGGEILHFTYANISEQWEQLHRLSSAAAEQEYQRGRRATLFSLVGNPILRMLKFYILKRGFREGVAGLIVAINEGYYTFMKYAKLWEMEHALEVSEAEQRTPHLAKPVSAPGDSPGGL